MDGTFGVRDFQILAQGFHGHKMLKLIYCCKEQKRVNVCTLQNATYFPFDFPGRLKVYNFQEMAPPPPPPAAGG
jgi:hypothetical protein